MLVFAYDTETTGMVLFKERSNDPRQPHIVQIAGALADTETREVVASIDLIVRPDGWEISDEMAEIHGITQEQATRLGVSEPMAMSSALQLWQIADYRLAHNEQFDSRIMRAAIARYGDETTAERWKQGRAECTAKLCRPICAIPPTPNMVAAGFNSPKTPKLQEAYQHFYGHPFEGAHSAMPDVLACLDVYWAASGAAGALEAS